MDVQVDPIRGTYDDLVEFAEDIGGILDAVGNNSLDLTPGFQAWLAEQLERVDLTLALAAIEECPS